MKKPKTVRVRIAVAVSIGGRVHTMPIDEHTTEAVALEWVESSANREPYIIEADLPIVETAVVRGRVRS